MSEPDDQPDQQPLSDHGRPGLSISTTGCPEDLEQAVQDAARHALASQGMTEGHLEIAVVGDTEMRRQHAQWMDDDTTTDTLTFDLRDDPSEGVVDGQLIVCKSVAKRRARARGIDWRAELMLYVVHGCLHLCGHDDHDEMEARRMHETEDRILGELGWGPVFYAEKPARNEQAGGAADQGAVR